MAEMSDDLPAFGNPTRPASAIVLSSSRSSLCSPGSPRNAKPGALRLVEASAALEGGQRGLGNAAPPSTNRKAAGFSLRGDPGQHKELLLELKPIADASLVGFPN